MDELPQVNEAVRVWYGPGFTRTGRVIEVDEQDRNVFVEFDYDIPNAWVRDDQIC